MSDPFDSGGKLFVPTELVVNNTGEDELLVSITQLLSEPLDPPEDPES